MIEDNYNDKNLNIDNLFKKYAEMFSKLYSYNLPAKMTKMLKKDYMYFFKKELKLLKLKQKYENKTKK